VPLIHSKRPKAFSQNVKTEMERGKGQKQAVAIAYRMAGEHKAKGGEMCAHGGPMHCDMGCYANGGGVKGVHHASSASLTGGESEAGLGTRSMKTAAFKEGREHSKKYAKGEHERVLSELRSMKGPHGNYAHGGWVGDEMLMGRKPSEYEERPQSIDPGFSEDPELLAEGGEVDEGEEKLEHVLAEELLTAMEHKDKKGVAEAIEALVLQCMNKGEME
jgi:hypothetical protein